MLGVENDEYLCKKSQNSSEREVELTFTIVKTNNACCIATLLQIMLVVLSHVNTVIF